MWRPIVLVTTIWRSKRSSHMVKTTLWVDWKIQLIVYIHSRVEVKSIRNVWSKSCGISLFCQLRLCCHCFPWLGSIPAKTCTKYQSTNLYIIFHLEYSNSWKSVARWCWMIKHARRKQWWRQGVFHELLSLSAKRTLQNEWVPLRDRAQLEGMQN